MFYLKRYGEKKKRKILTFLAVVLMIGMMPMVYAEELTWNQDTASGTYTTAEAYVSGYWYYPPGELRDTYAHVKGTVIYTLPDDMIVVGFQFQWDGYDTGWSFAFDPEIDDPGEWLKASVTPGTVTYIISSGRVGYGHEVAPGEVEVTWDTREVSASIPFT